MFTEPRPGVAVLKLQTNAPVCAQNSAETDQVPDLKKYNVYSGAVRWQEPFQFYVNSSLALQAQVRFGSYYSEFTSAFGDYVQFRTARHQQTIPRLPATQLYASDRISELDLTHITQTAALDSVAILPPAVCDAPALPTRDTG